MSASQRFTSGCCPELVEMSTASKYQPYSPDNHKRSAGGQARRPSGWTADQKSAVLADAGALLLLLLFIAAAYRTVYNFPLVGDARSLILENHFIRDFSFLWQNFSGDFFFPASSDPSPY